MKIVFINDQGRMSIMCPSPEALELYGLEAIAIKDVPSGKPFKFVGDDVIPKGREARDAWMLPLSELTDGVGGVSDAFPQGDEA